MYLCGNCYDRYSNIEYASRTVGYLFEPTENTGPDYPCIMCGSDCLYQYCGVNIYRARPTRYDMIKYPGLTNKPIFKLLRSVRRNQIISNLIS